MSTGVDLTGLKGEPGKFLLMGLHSVIASFTNDLIGLHDTYINLSILEQLRIDFRHV